MRWPQLKDALLETAKLTVMIFTIIWGVLIYVRFLVSRTCRAPSPTGSRRLTSLRC